MSLQWPAPLLTSGGGSPWTAAQAAGLPEFQTPLPSTTAELIFTQKFWQFRANVVPTGLNTSHPSSGLTPDYSSFFLISESPKKRDMTQGVVEWERTYAVKPASHSEGESHDYQFIGFVGVWLSTTSSGFVNNVAPAIVATVTGRPRKSYIVTSRLQFDYFLVAGAQYQGAWSSGTAYTPGQGVSDSGVYYTCTAAVGPVGTHPASDPSHWSVAATPDYTTEKSIPVNYAQRYFANGGTLLNGLLTDFLTDGVGSLAATLPGLTDYLSWVSNGVTLGWTADLVGNWRGAWGSSGVYAVGDGVSDVSINYTCISPVGPSATHPAGDATHWAVYHPAQMVAEDSRLARWNGNIWVRTTRYVLPL